MSRIWEHAAEVAFLIVIIFLFYKNCEMFNGDPYGTGLRYLTQNDSTTSGAGSNYYLFN